MHLEDNETHLVERARGWQWKCIECKECEICGTKGDDVSSLLNFPSLVTTKHRLSARLAFSSAMPVIEAGTPIALILLLNICREGSGLAQSATTWNFLT
jgi:hypothetical protein